MEKLRVVIAAFFIYTRGNVSYNEKADISWVGMYTFYSYAHIRLLKEFLIEIGSGYFEDHENGKPGSIGKPGSLKTCSPLQAGPLWYLIPLKKLEKILEKIKFYATLSMKKRLYN